MAGSRFRTALDAVFGWAPTDEPPLYCPLCDERLSLILDGYEPVPPGKEERACFKCGFKIVKHKGQVLVTDGSESVIVEDRWKR